MTAERVQALEALLTEAEAAHGAYEAAELNGVYDAEWPRWYAAYAVDHGIAGVFGRAVETDELADFLAVSWKRREETDAARREPWVTSTARELAAAF
jgi:hypothetical protein